MTLKISWYRALYKNIVVIINFYFSLKHFSLFIGVVRSNKGHEFSFVLGYV